MESLSSSAFWMAPSRNSASATPTSVPRPPKIETPPSSTAVMAGSAKDWPRWAGAGGHAEQPGGAGGEPAATLSHPARGPSLRNASYRRLADDHEGEPAEQRER